MQVLMIAQSNYDYDARILRQTAALVRNNIQVDIICLGIGDYLKFEKLENVNVHRIMKRFPQERAVHYIFFSLIFLFKSMIKALNLMKKGKPDVIQIHNMPDYLVFSALFHKLKGIPVVLDIHDLSVELFREKWGDKKFRLIKPLLVGIEKLSVGFADKVITVSDQCGERLQQRGLSQNKLTIVMNVADTEFFKFNDSRSFEVISNNLKIMYHGTIAYRYGLHNTISALPKVVEKIPGTVFTIIGNKNSEYGQYLEKLAEKLKVTDNVSFNPSVPYEEVHKYINIADIAVITEMVGPYSNFGIPTKAFEYAASGLPFLINDLEVNRSVFRDNSVSFVKHDDLEQIAMEIIDLALNPDRRREMSKNAFQDLQKVSISVMQERYRNLIFSFNHKQTAKQFSLTSVESKK